jgi:hypothetical protein
MKLALIIAIYNRHELETIVIDNFKRQSEKFGFEIIIAGSEGEVSKELAKGLHYIEVPNFPISNKHNSMLVVAQHLQVDGVVLMGSDDFVSDSFWTNIYKFTPTETNVKGLSDLYFYSVESKKIGYFKGYKNTTQSVGAGRFFSKFVLEKMDWKLWSDGLNVGLDSDCSTRCKSQGIEDNLYSMKESKAVLIDVKCGISITNEAIIDTCEIMDTKKVFSKIDKNTIDKINLLEVIKPEPLDLDFNKEYSIMSTGNRYLGDKGTIHTMLGESALIIINKGFGKLCQ